MGERVKNIEREKRKEKSQRKREVKSEGKKMANTTFEFKRLRKTGGIRRQREKE